MGKVLLLVHRLPYPPNKGDKVRSYHLLRHLCARHQVFLGTFVDDPDDERHLDTVRAWCADMHVARLHPRRARLASLPALLTSRPLTLAYYGDRGLQRWVRQVAREHALDACVVFSSSMAQYAEPLADVPLLLDFVDVDSAKWTEYARRHRWPMSWVYGREGRHLLAYEREMAQRARRAFFVTEQETALFTSLAPECRQQVEPLGNGVDATFYTPGDAYPRPFAAGEQPVVFTGAMDYWPNVDAAQWFARDILPALLQRCPAARFYVVGRSPTREVQALAGDRVVVTGTVPDVRPYLQHAAVIVAPLRLARGIQNKVLEGMAMARPVVASAQCAGPIGAVEEAEILTAGDAEGFVQQVARVLADPAWGDAIGRAARERVLQQFSWEAHLSRLDRHLPAPAAREVHA